VPKYKNFYLFEIITKILKLTNLDPTKMYKNRYEKTKMFYKAVVPLESVKSVLSVNHSWPWFGPLRRMKKMRRRADGRLRKSADCLSTGRSTGRRFKQFEALHFLVLVFHIAPGKNSRSILRCGV
jgi:hypothetical protein